MAYLATDLNSCPLFPPLPPQATDLHRHFIDHLTIPSKQGKGVLRWVVGGLLRLWLRGCCGWGAKGLYACDETPVRIGHQACGVTPVRSHCDVTPVGSHL